MATVIAEFSINQYKVLQLDELDAPRDYWKYVIDGKTYDIVSLYDLPNCIAIESTGSFIGKTVEFVREKYEPFVPDPDACDGTYVGAGRFETVVKNNYDIRAFLKYKQATGREWKDLSDSEKSKFCL